MRTAAVNSALEKTISRPRLEKYLVQKEGDLHSAIGLYEYNTKVSEAFYTPLQSLEICLRNVIDSCMASAYGREWFNNGNAPLGYDAQNEILAAYKYLGGQENVPPGSVVAEIKFSFWVGLLGPRYDATIWRRAIYRGFQSTTGKKRSDVHGRFNALRRFRNRVAHHEPIFHRDLAVVHAEIVEAIGWMCQDTKRWTEHNSRVLSVVTSN